MQIVGIDLLSCYPGFNGNRLKFVNDLLFTAIGELARVKEVGKIKLKDCLDGLSER